MNRAGGGRYSGQRQQQLQRPPKAEIGLDHVRKGKKWRM